MSALNSSVVSAAIVSHIHKKKLANITKIHPLQKALYQHIPKSNCIAPLKKDGQTL